jgi:hypothetical protein
MTAKLITFDAEARRALARGLDQVARAGQDHTRAQGPQRRAREGLGRADDHQRRRLHRERDRSGGPQENAIREAPMSIGLQDPAHFETPSGSPVGSTAALEPRIIAGKRVVSFELESPGGYRRTVTGTIAYLDDEAHTYMLRGHDAELIRVPLRDIEDDREHT